MHGKHPVHHLVPVSYTHLEIEGKTKDNENITFKFISYNNEKIELNNEEEVNHILENIKNEKLVVEKIESKTRRKSAPKPFTTSMLQQEAANKLSFTTKKTMMVAQELYEGVDIEGEGTVGLISYIRTDSKRISDEAKEKAKTYIIDDLGEKYYKEHKEKKDNKEKKKVQDAHEAIRRCV